jgi:hypothetical protein
MKKRAAEVQNRWKKIKAYAKVIARPPAVHPNGWILYWLVLEFGNSTHKQLAAVLLVYFIHPPPLPFRLPPAALFFVFCLVFVVQWPTETAEEKSKPKHIYIRHSALINHGEAAGPVDIAPSRALASILLCM